MFPVTKLARQLEEEWGEEISRYLDCSSGEFRAAPSKYMRFPQTSVRVELMDGSFAEFKCAFAVPSEPKKAIAVFTEHCGHHVFPCHEARVFANGRLTYMPGRT